MNFERRQFIPDPQEKVRPKVPDIPALTESLEKIEAQEQLKVQEVQDLYVQLDQALSGMDESGRTTFNEKILGQILTRVEQECGHLGNFGSLEEGRRLMSMPTSEYIRSLYPDIDGSFTMEEGSFSPFENKIRLRKSVSADLTPESLLRDLVEYGSSPAMTTLHHEVIHSKQFDEINLEDRMLQIKVILDKLITKLRLAGIAGGLTALAFPQVVIPGAMITGLLLFTARIKKQNKKIIQEGQAFYGSSKFSSDEASSAGVKTVEELIDRLQYSYGIWERDTGKIVSMTHDIKRLYALGMSDEAIGEAVKKAKWDAKGRCYDNLERAVQALSASSGLTETQIDDLVAADDINSIIYVEKVRRIAQEELKTAIGELSASQAT